MRAVASAIVRTQDLHPSLVRLRAGVARRAGDVGKEELDDVGLFLSGLRALEPSERKLSLQLVAVACIIDGKLSRRERTLWADAMASSGQEIAFQKLEGLRVAFVRGDGFADDVLRTI